jgi:uncharacterized protein
LGHAVTETPFFFETQGARLFALEHMPESGSTTSALVLSHAFGEEKLWSHRVFVSLARELARRGWIVLRFDYTGAGDSEGSTSETSLETHLTDLASAFQTLTSRHPNLERVGFAGLRLGATMAALLAERVQEHDGFRALRAAPLVLWDPILDGEGYFNDILRSNLSTQLAVYGKVVENRERLLQKIRAGGTVNVDGYEIGKALVDSCSIPDLLAAGAKRHRGATLVAQIAPSAQVQDREDLRTLASAYGNGTFVRAMEQPFWREIKPFYGRASELQQATLAWLEQKDA